MSRPARVLQILMCDGIGGTEAIVSTLAERMDPAQVQTQVVTLSGHGPVARRLSQSQTRVRSLGHDTGFAGASRRLAAVIAREPFDVVNAYGIKATTVARTLMRVLRPDAAFVCGVRGLYVTEAERVGSRKARVVTALERFGSPLVDVYDANSTGALELLAQAGVARSKLRYIPNGIDLERWPAVELGDRQEPVVVCAARFTARKRQIDLVRAAEELNRRGVRFRLVLAGDGPSLNAVRSASAAGGDAGGRISFEGAIEPARMPAQLAAADVVCLPSMWEGMANGVMEAMACGLPVVGTDVNGISDLVVDGETGTLVAPERPDQLADALQALLTDAGRRRRLGAAGRARVAQSFTVDSMVAAKTALYRELAFSTSSVS